MKNPCIAYCDELISMAKTRPDIVYVSGDSSEIMFMDPFVAAFPERSFNAGIAEQVMTNIAGGLATVGFTPFVSAFAMFQTYRAGDQLRNGIAYPGLNVKIVSSNVGVNVGKNGVTHHALEDLAMMRSIPDMVVLSPADAEAARQLVRLAADRFGPVYMRLDKIPIPDVYGEGESFEIGKGKVLREGNDVAIFATGSMVSTALEAERILQSRQISASVIDIHTIKPLDKTLILDFAAKTGAIVTAEPHSIIGGLGGAVSELLGQEWPIPIERVGVKDVFTESGSPSDLNKKYGLDAPSVAEAAEKALLRKGKRVEC